MRKCLKVEYLGQIEYDFQKSRVTGPWDHEVLVTAEKVKQKISCLCTFKRAHGGKVLSINVWSDSLKEVYRKKIVPFLTWASGLK
jgi:hypothetical protein